MHTFDLRKQVRRLNSSFLCITDTFHNTVINLSDIFSSHFRQDYHPTGGGGGGGGTSYNSVYGEVPPKRGTFFRLEVYKRVGISRAEV